MKNINMPIKKIKEYLKLAQKGDSTLQERYEMILEQKLVRYEMRITCKSCENIYKKIK